MKTDFSANSIQVNVQQICLVAITWMLLTTVAVVIPGISFWIKAPLSLVAGVGIPGLLFAIVFRISPQRTLRFSLYSFGLGLCVLIFGGLTLNWSLLLVGINEPLAPVPVMFFLDSVVLLACLWIHVFTKDFIFHYEMAIPTTKSLVFGLIPTIFVILSVIGTQILNNGGPGTLTLVLLFVIAGYVLALMYWGSEVQEWVYIVALYTIALSLLLMYSLRSTHIIGWDINQEYQVFMATYKHFAWKMSYYPGLDYNSCLSITILPTLLAVLTGIPSEYIFKFIFQLFFASTPVMVYVLAKSYMGKVHAFLAALLVISQTWFYEQMPALIRQETAFLFYLLIMVVLFDTSLTKRIRYIFLYLFSFALIVSHYSTAYVWLTLLFGGLILSYIGLFFVPVLRHKSTFLSPLMLIVPLLFLFLWEVPLTHTGGAVTNFISHTNTKAFISQAPHSSTTESGPSQSSITTSLVVASTTSTKSLHAESLTPFVVAGIPIDARNAFSTIFFAERKQNSNADILAAERSAIRHYGDSTLHRSFSDASSSIYTPQQIDTTHNLVNKLPVIISGAVTLLEQGVKLILIDLFPIIGIATLFFARRDERKESYGFAFLNIGAYVLILLMIFVPYLQTYYNFTRLYLQMFLALSVFALMGGLLITKKIQKYQSFLLAFLIVIFFCSLSGALDQLTGGAARITLNQPPSTLEMYYISDSEIASARWLSDIQAEDPIQADAVANLRLQSFANTNAELSPIFPETIHKNSYVYLINQNTGQGRAFVQYQEKVLTYTYPTDFLDTHKGLIYDNGSSRVYR